MKRDSDPCPMLYDEQLFKLFGLPFKQLDFLMRYLLINHFDNILIAKVHGVDSSAFVVPCLQVTPSDGEIA